MKTYNIENFCDDILNNFKQKGIDDIELAISKSKVLSVQTRKAKLENIQSSSGISITLNVILGKKQATLSANNLEDIMAKDLLDQGKFMAESSPDDPFAGLPNYDEYASTLENLDLEDKYKLSESKLIDSALQAENEMLNVNNVTNTEGGNALSLIHI